VGGGGGWRGGWGGTFTTFGTHFRHRPPNQLFSPPKIQLAPPSGCWNPRKNSRHPLSQNQPVACILTLVRDLAHRHPVPRTQGPRPMSGVRPLQRALLTAVAASLIKEPSFEGEDPDLSAVS